MVLYPSTGATPIGRSLPSPGADLGAETPPQVSVPWPRRPPPGLRGFLLPAISHVGHVCRSGTAVNRAQRLQRSGGGEWHRFGALLNVLRPTMHASLRAAQHNQFIERRGDWFRLQSQI